MSVSLFVSCVRARAVFFLIITLEKLSLQVFGVKQRGSKEDPPMSHATGIGYVAKRDGDYSDAIVNKKLKVHMLSCCSWRRSAAYLPEGFPI